MPIFTPLPYVVKLEAVFSSCGERVQNVHHFKGPDAVPEQADMEALALAYVTWWTSEWAPQCKASTQLELIRLTDCTTQDSPAYDYVTDLPVAGSRATGTEVPNNVTYTASWRTNYRGRSFRGRTYAVGMCVNDTIGNQLGTGVAATFQGKWAALLTALPEGWVLGVASRWHSKFQREVGVFTPVTHVIVEGNLDSQRRRLTGRG